MAIAFDAVAEGSSSNATSITWSHTISGTDRFLYVGVGRNGTGAVSNITYNGVTFTVINLNDQTSSGSKRLSDGYLIAPSTGANNVVVTMTSTPNQRIGSLSYTGVDQTTPIDTNGTGNSSLSNTLTIGTTNAWHIAYFYEGGGTFRTLTGQDTVRDDAIGGSNYMISEDSGTGLATGSNSLTVTVTGAATGVISNGISINPAVAAATPTPRRRHIFHR